MKTKISLPENYKPYVDKYFLRTKEILEAENLNPFVRAQIFIRNGPGKVYGLDETLEILDKYTPLVKNGGRVYSLKEGTNYNSRDTLMLIEARVQDIVELETMYLGVISAETTKANDKHEINLKQIKENMSLVVEASRGRPVLYFGARHWRFDEDVDIARAAYEGGATDASTDIGAEAFGKKGVGTIPHALENIMAWKYGYENAVVEATKSFDRVIDKEVPRVALIDYANREIDDSLKVAMNLEGKLYGVRVDTCGENVMQGAIYSSLDMVSILHGEDLIKIPENYSKYWFGKGVTISGVNTLRRALDFNGFKDVKIVLTSGFGDVEKVKAFVDAEDKLGVKLFDSLGVGGIFPSRMTTMDIVSVGDTLEDMIPMSKVGRGYNSNSKLELRLGGKK